LSESRIERRERERREEALREEALKGASRRGNPGREYPDRGDPRIERKRERERERELERKRRRRRAGGIVALIIILLVAFTGIRIWLDTRPGAAEPIVASGAAEFSGNDRVNILFLGTNQGLSDTMMVFSLDFASKRLDEISIPRDTYYPRSNYSGAAYQKINSVYSTEGYQGACKAASDVLGGIPIHFYGVLDSAGIVKIVDAMGGVEMNVPINMDYEDPDQNLYIHLKAGPQLLNGDQAMQYLRFRSGYANADLGRVSAQQEFLKAVLSQSSAFDIPKIALVASQQAKTNLGMTTALGLLARASGMQGWAFNTQTIPGKTGMQNGLSYFFADAAGTKAMMDQIYAAQ